VNNSDLFKTTDVPAVKIKNIRIDQGQKSLYKWPLNEKSGNVAIDEVHAAKASVLNPEWIASLHFNWVKLQHFSFGGLAQVAFDPSMEALYVTGQDSLLKYYVNKNNLERICYNEPAGSPVLFWDQTFYDTITQKLYRYSIDKQFIAFFDFERRRWSEELKNTYVETNFWHHNKTVSNVDTCLYVFGGYGHHKYKNTVWKLNYRKNTWETVKNEGDSYTPRYLAALGQNAKGDTAYIIGGYGSESGEQILNPGNYYDLFSYSLKSHTFKKMYGLQVGGEEFCFGNSLVIDKTNNHFYGLTFPQNKFDCNLQLLEGSLNSRDYHWVGSKIPYKFYDIKSFADLYYCPASKLLLAVTIYRNDHDVSEIDVYAVKFPPNYAENIVLVQEKKGIKKISYAILIVLITFSFLFLFIRKKRKKKRMLRLADPTEDKPVHEKTGIRVLEEIQVPARNEYPETTVPNSILLFGDFMVINKAGKDITKKFSPLIKELFLLILLYSIRHTKGVSVEKLDEILWFDKDERSARNNRAVNIAKLKELITELDDTHLNNNGGYWKLEFDTEHLYVDYQKVLYIIKDISSPEPKRIKSLLQIIRNGSFLTSLAYEWLDKYKSQLSNDLIDLLVKFAKASDVGADPNFMMEIADALFQLDSVNEDEKAMHLLLWENTAWPNRRIQGLSMNTRRCITRSIKRRLSLFLRSEEMDLVLYICIKQLLCMDIVPIVFIK
jgi:two-component SAPR family response regulator